MKTRINSGEAYDNEYGAAYWGNRGAGILAVAEDTGNVLVALRSQHVNEPNTWGTVGGKVDDDESFEDAALREFDEETGYSGPIDLISGYKFVDPPVFEYQNFIGVVPEEFDVGNTTWETAQFAWVSPEELKNLGPKHPGLAEFLNVDFNKIVEIVERDNDMSRLSKIIAYLKRVAQFMGDIPVRDTDINPLSIQRSPVSEGKKERKEDKNKSKRKKDDDATIMSGEKSPADMSIFNMAPEYQGTPHLAQVYVDEDVVIDWMEENYERYARSPTLTLDDFVEDVSEEFNHPEWVMDQWNWVWDAAEYYLASGSYFDRG